MDISQWASPGWVFNWVLIVCYNSDGDTFSAGIHVGTDYIREGDPCDWAVGGEPAFVSPTVATRQADDPTNYLECGPDGKLHGLLTMTGQDTGWSGADATNCTATVTI